MKWENHQTLLTVLVTLIVAIFGFAQVYILFSVKQVDNRITRLNLIEDRLDTLTQNHLIVDLRINETLQTGVVRKLPLPFSRLVGTVCNSADAVRLETAPTGERKRRDMNLDLHNLVY